MWGAVSSSESHSSHSLELPHSKSPSRYNTDSRIGSSLQPYTAMTGGPSSDTLELIFREKRISAEPVDQLSAITAPAPSHQHLPPPPPPLPAPSASTISNYTILEESRAISTLQDPRLLQSSSIDPTGRSLYLLPISAVPTAERSRRESQAQAQALLTVSASENRSVVPLVGASQNTNENRQSLTMVVSPQPVVVPNSLPPPDHQSAINLTLGGATHRSATELLNPLSINTNNRSVRSSQIDPQIPTIHHPDYSPAFTQPPASSSLHESRTTLTTFALNDPRVPLTSLAPPSHSSTRVQLPLLTHHHALGAGAPIPYFSHGSSSPPPPAPPPPPSQPHVLTSSFIYSQPHSQVIVRAEEKTFEVIGQPQHAHQVESTTTFSQSRSSIDGKYFKRRRCLAKHHEEKPYDNPHHNIRSASSHLRVESATSAALYGPRILEGEYTYNGRTSSPPRSSHSININNVNNVINHPSYNTYDNLSIPYTLQPSSRHFIHNRKSSSDIEMSDYPIRSDVVHFTQTHGTSSSPPHSHASRSDSARSSLSRRSNEDHLDNSSVWRPY